MQLIYGGESKHSFSRYYKYKQFFCYYLLFFYYELFLWSYNKKDEKQKFSALDTIKSQSKEYGRFYTHKFLYLDE